jgi:carbamoylphosphate synthase large subunit
VKILHLQKKSFSSRNGFPSATGEVSADVELIVHCLIASSKLVECGLCVLQVKMPFEDCKDPIPDELYRQACVYTTEEALASCQKIGYPAMIKASWGGGGKGIRKV